MPKKGIAIIIAGFLLILISDIFSSFAFIEGFEGIDEHKLWLCPVSAEFMTYDYADSYECRPVYYTRQVDKMVNLRELWIEGKDRDEAGGGYLVMDDFSFLAKMPYLQELSLDFYDDSDYTTFPLMPSLRELTMPFASVSALPEDLAARVPELTYMRIGWSDSIDRLAGLDRLVSLGIQINEGGNIYGIENLDALKELSIDAHCDIDLSPLAGCASLEVLRMYIYPGGHPDYSPLADCRELKELNLYCSDGDNAGLDFLSGCKELERVHIWFDCDESALAFIADCPKLKEAAFGMYYDTGEYDEEDGLLIQYDGKITDTSAFAARGDVRTLDIWADEVTDYSGLLEMPSLEKLCVLVNMKELALYEDEEKLREYRAAFKEQERIFAGKGVKAEIWYYNDYYEHAERILK